MLDDKDMVEINLSTRCRDCTDLYSCQSHCLTKSLSITDLQDRGSQNRIAYQQKYATIAGAKCKGGSPNISCLRQMYCPDCHQRLDKESVRFETMLACCLPLSPLSSVYECCRKHSFGRQVICNKCGSNLGFWMRS